MPTVIGLFDDRTEAMRAYDALLSGGFRSADLDILTNDDKDDVPKLAKLGDSVPEPDVHVYLAGVHQGGTLVTVSAAENTVTKAAEIMAGYHMVNIPARVEELRKTRSTLQLTDPKTDEHVLEVVEEELEVGTQQVERGRMRIYSKVSERAVERQVSLRDETIRVRRRPVSREVPVSDPALFQERSYEMTEVDEEAVVHIRARVIEEVVIGKEVAEKIETIQQTLRRTDVEIEEVPEARRFDDYAADFRSFYTQRLAKSGLGYEKYSPAFRFGHSLATNEPFRSQSWGTIEPDVRRLWEEKNPGTWAQLKDAVRFSWERVRGAR
jgi:stress response protein YsnF